MVWWYHCTTDVTRRRCGIQSAVLDLIARRNTCTIGIYELLLVFHEMSHMCVKSLLSACMFVCCARLVFVRVLYSAKLAVAFWLQYTVVEYCLYICV